MSREIKFSAVILAGGESRRMGRDKAGVQWKGRSLLRRAVSIVRRAGAQEIFISGREGVDYSQVKCPVLLDLKPGLGPLGGIERALVAVKFPLVLVLAVDMPGMTAAVLRKQLSCCKKNKGVVPSRDGELEPLAGIYPKSAHMIVGRMLQRNRLAVRDFAESCIHKSLVRRIEMSPKDCRCFSNLNSPADLRRVAVCKAQS